MSRRDDAPELLILSRESATRKSRLQGGGVCCSAMALVFFGKRIDPPAFLNDCVFVVLLP